MGLTEVISLDADVTYSLGKLNKSTGKTDPKSVEGYYLGYQQLPDNKYGKSGLHYFKTKTGTVAIWRAGDLDKKLANVKVGTMTKAEFVGMKPTNKGDMRSFKVYNDKANFIEVEIEASAPVSDDDETELILLTDGSYAAQDPDDENESEEELPVAAAPAGLTPAQRQKKVQDLLNAKKR